ncbi:MAG: hypothetical protein JXR05_03760 [Flavobacteriaceae bacterium]
MSWFVTTQAAYLVNAKLFDNSKTYFEKSKQSININPPLAQGAEIIQGNNIRMIIEEPQSSNLRASINAYNITNDSGSVVGYGYNISIEDYLDEDFNDVCISLVAWRNKG